MKTNPSGRHGPVHPIRHALGILLGAVILSGCAGPNAERLNTTEKMMWSTYPLASEKVIGTCFLVAAESRRNPGRFLPVVVTSTHVLKAAGKDPFVVPLRMVGVDGQTQFVLVQVGGGKQKPPFYVSHPTLDVAAFPLPVPMDLESEVFLRLLEEENLADGSFRVGDPVAFLGFPEGLPGSPDFFPILRQGGVASYDPNRLATRFFLINADVYPGDSGAPVFRTSPKGRPRVVGMVVERLEVQKGERSPLALAVDVAGVRETVSLLVDRLD